MKTNRITCSFFGRHPTAAFWIFAVSPAAAMVLAFVSACLGILAVGALCQKAGFNVADKNHLAAVAR